MSDIHKNLPSIAQHGKQLAKVDSRVEGVIDGIVKDRKQAVHLRSLELGDFDKLSPGVRSRLSEMLGQQLRGQLPPSLAEALNRGEVDAAMLSQLAMRLANSVSPSGDQRTGVAPSPEAARNAAANPELPQQALQWGQFVQATTTVDAEGVQDRAGSAAPKGEGTVLTELIASKLAEGTGAGLRNPFPINKSMSALTPEQQLILMGAIFGDELAAALQDLGIGDPFSFVKAGIMPSDRSMLAHALKMPRARLLAYLLRAELLNIGPGRSGELGMQPEFLDSLKDIGVTMLASLAALRGLDEDDFQLLYRKLRRRTGGFRRAMAGSRSPVKRDLMYWSRSASRRRSEILLHDHRERQGRMDRDDAQERIQAWYLEQLLWAQLDLERIDEEQRQMQREQEDDDADQRDRAEAELEYDNQREDRLMCFWVVQPSLDPTEPGTRRMYVCVDPQSGAIVPQLIEREVIDPSK